MKIDLNTVGYGLGFISMVAGVVAYSLETSEDEKKTITNLSTVSQQRLVNQIVSDVELINLYPDGDLIIGVISMLARDSILVEKFKSAVTKRNQKGIEPRWRVLACDSTADVDKLDVLFANGYLRYSGNDVLDEATRQNKFIISYQAQIEDYMLNYYIDQDSIRLEFNYQKSE